MKIQVLDTNSKKPLANAAIKILIKGKNSDNLEVRTDKDGYFQLDDAKYKGHQIATANNAQGTWAIANDQAKLYSQPKQNFSQAKNNFLKPQNPNYANNNKGTQNYSGQYINSTYNK